MRIGINTRFLLKNKMEGFGWYTFEICKRLVEKHPEHQFVFFFDRAFDPSFVFGPNVTPVVLFPPARHPILFRIWFDWSIPKALKKHKIDVFFSPDGYLSLRTIIKQVGTIHDINFEHFPEDIPKGARYYLRSFFSRFAKKAAHILTVSEYSKQDIAKTYGIVPDKITAIWNGANPKFQPLSESGRIDIRKLHSNEKPYFLFVGSLHPRKNLKRLMQAYEQLLSEEPETENDLLIVGTALWKEEKIDTWVSEETLCRIHFKGHLPLDILTNIVAAADIFVYVPYFEGFGIPLVEAMHCGVPIISGNKTSLPEVAGDAALYCDPFSVLDIAEKMKLLVRDPNLKKELSQKGLVRAKEFSWDKAADAVWEVLSEI
ncbi:MAG: glycosyltransferase family 1 protein [Crocinitomicaceae bacterium]|nr:glycosyltransferase family 1 protein [Crocinitomicaceae bacterium]